MSDEQKRLAKEARRRQFQASRPDLVNAKPATKPSKTERKAAALARQPILVEEKEKKQERTVVKVESVEERTACKGLFDHLPAYREHSSQSLNLHIGARHAIHPSFIAFGLAVSNQILTGSNARSVAFLDALRQLLDDYECPAGNTFSRHFETFFQKHMAFLNDIRPLSVAIRNIAVAVSSAVSKLDPNITNVKAKRDLCEMLQRYSDERVIFAINAIAKLAEDKIKDGDSIMIYSRCDLIEEILINAHKKGISFRVVVVDAGPRFEGRQTLHRLIRECPELSCSYVLIQSVTFAMKEVTKAFLSATAMMANGAAQARVGTAVVAVMAQTYHIPCIVCCESRKFSENAQVNAITKNEMCDCRMLLDEKLQETPGIGVLNLAYDITPAHLITMVISEVGCIPATSVPAVTREFMKSM